MSVLAAISATLILKNRMFDNFFAGQLFAGYHCG